MAARGPAVCLLAGARLAVSAAMRTSALLSIPFVLTLAVEASASVMLLPVKGTNLAQGEVDAIGEMVTNAYQVEAKESVIAPALSKKALDETGGYSQAAQKLGAHEYILVTAVRLESRIVLTATRYGADGHYIYSAKMSATSLDDIEPASERLANAVVHEQSPSSSRTTDNVTRTEENQPIRANSQKVAGFKGSFTYPIGWNKSAAPQMSGAFDLRLENGQHFIEVGVGLTFPTPDARGYGGIWLDIGGNLYLGSGNTAPYLGVGIMPRLMSHSVANLAPYLQGGVMFFRDSSTRFYGDVRIAQNLLPVTFTGDAKESERLFPTELTFSLGMGF